MRDFEAYVKRRFLGRHVLSGVWSGERPNPRQSDWRTYDACQSLLMLIDGVVYQSLEDPDDGYRSHLDYLIERPEFFPVNWWNTSEKVIGYYCDYLYRRWHREEDDEWEWWTGASYPKTQKEFDNSPWNRHEAEALVFVSEVTRKKVLVIGTDRGDDYYPSCIQAFWPENMSINSEARKHVDIIGWDKEKEND